MFSHTTKYRGDPIETKIAGNGDELQQLSERKRKNILQLSLMFTNYLAPNILC